MAITKRITMSTVRARYAERNPDGHWFDRKTLQFFKTKLPQFAYESDKGDLFVTRETNWSDRTAYSVRCLRADGEIDTIGEFHSHRSSTAAMVTMYAYAEGRIDKDGNKLVPTDESA